MATDPTTAESGPRKVVATLPHVDQLLTLWTSAGKVVTTEDHKYWNATDRAWQESQYLDVGDHLLTADGDRVLVEGLDWTTAHTSSAYDLTIEDMHAFYVGVGEDNNVLVHNSCGPWGVSNNRFDPDAQALANEIGGSSQIEYLGREIDAVSLTEVGQAKPASEALNPRADVKCDSPLMLLGRQTER